jgi:hypothetical protein
MNGCCRGEQTVETPVRHHLNLAIRHSNLREAARETPYPLHIDRGGKKLAEVGNDRITVADT